MNEGRTDDTTAPVPARFRLLLIGLLLGVLLGALDGTMVAVALPTIVGDLGGIEDTHWVITAYLLTATASTLLYGRVSDLLGRKPVFLAAIVIFLAGSALCAAAQGMGTLAAARALQGLGGGGLLTLALAVIADVVPPRQRARFQGLFGAVFGLASVLGPVIGGPVVDHASWRWLFLLNLPIGAVVLAIVATQLPLPVSRREHRLDLRGAFLLAAAVGCFLCWMTRGNEVGWSDPRSWLLGVGAAVLAPAFVLSQRSAPEPVLPLGLFRNPTFALTGAVAFCVGAAMFAAILFIPLVLQLVQDRSATSSGLMLAAMTTGLLVSSVGVGRAVSRTGRHKAPPVVGTVLITVAMLGLTRLDVDTSAGYTIAMLTVLGLGIGFVSPVLVAVAQSSVDARDLGIATASVSFFRNLGGTVGSAVGVAVLTHRLSDGFWFASAPLQTGQVSTLPDQVQALPASAQEAYGTYLADAATGVFWIAAAVGAIAVVLAALTPALTLNQIPAESDQPESGDQYEPPPNSRAAAPTSPAS
ncbi:MDR family MFS transporter [Sporichthya sp.]|uniref:MDR family MFS transporter n=1 Tax=Sporichthya sp. TaxID=65475 RepID=UPI0017C77ABF|nr:MDR family MFS transporter [Sporichthya sp.]MBA3743169.1 MFS transporter [Sporichthya sp.]